MTLDRQGGRPDELLDEPAPKDPKATLPQAGRSLSGRLARRLTDGPGSGAFRAAVAARALWWQGADAVDRGVGRAHALPQQSGPERRSVRVQGFPTVARVDDRATVRSAHLRLLGLLHEELTRAGVPYFVANRDQYFFDVGAPAGHRVAVWAALTAISDREPIVVGRVHPVRPPVFRTVEAAGRRIREANVLRVLPVVTPATSAATLPESAAVEVHLWSELPDGVLGAPVRNRYAPYLLANTQKSVTTVDVEGVSMRTFADLAEPHVDDLAFPVDLVYTWVDDTDLVWRQRMQSAREALGVAVTANGIADERFRNFDELRYTLRSAGMFAPWVRHVWIVTDDQVPEWLEGEQPGLTVVSHRDIWSDDEALPVFNSHAIESRLHHIPGLAEHYIYLNDDMFFGQLTSPLLFFTPGGLPSIFASPEQIGLGVRTLREGAAPTAAKNDRRVLRDAVGVVQTQRLKHAGYPQLRSVALELEERFGEDYARTARSRFRSPEDISAVSLQSWYAYRTGRAVPGAVNFSYVDLRNGSDVSLLSHQMSNGGIDVFCLNQSENSVADPEVLRRDMHRFLELTFPFRSVYERD